MFPVRHAGCRDGEVRSWSPDGRGHAQLRRRVSGAPSREKIVPARAAEEPMQGLWRRWDMPAQTGEEHMQGERRGAKVMPARAAEEPMQGVRRLWDMPAQTGEARMLGVWRGGDMPARTAEAPMQGVWRKRSAEEHVPTAEEHFGAWTVRGIGEKSGKIVPSLPAGRHWKEVPVFLQGIAAGEKGVSSRVGFSECDRATLRMVSWFTGSSACRVTILQ